MGKSIDKLKSEIADLEFKKAMLKKGRVIKKHQFSNDLEFRRAKYG